MKNIFSELSTFQDRFSSLVLEEVNGSPVSIRSMQGYEVPPHTHAQEDEMFLVLSGTLYVDVGNQTKELTKGQFYCVKAGEVHRVRAEERVELLVVGGEKINTNIGSASE